MEDYGLLLFFASQMLIVVTGAIVLRTARQRPRTVALVIGGAVAAGLAAVNIGADAALQGLDVWKGWYPLGLGVVLVGCPAWLLVLIAREPNGPTLGPVTGKEWAQSLGGYLIACWMFAFTLAILAFFTTTPSGQFR